jgi:hypothetical protein
MNLDALVQMIYKEGYTNGYRDSEHNKVKLEILNRDAMLDKITSLVCAYFKITEEMLFSKSRKGTIVKARKMSMMLMRGNTKMKLEDIGDYFGGRDHTTVIHSIESLKDLIDVDEEINKEWEYLSSVFKEWVEKNGDLEIQSREFQSEIKRVKRKTGLMKPISSNFHQSVYTRPAAEYSNTGYLSLVKKLSEVG